MVERSRGSLCRLRQLSSQVLVVALCHTWESSLGPASSVPCPLTSAWSPSPVAFLSHILDVSASPQCLAAFLASRCPFQDPGQLLGDMTYTHSQLRNIQQPLPTVLRVTANPSPVSLLRPPALIWRCLPPAHLCPRGAASLQNPPWPHHPPIQKEPAPRASEFPPPVTVCSGAGSHSQGAEQIFLVASSDFHTGQSPK